MRPKLFRIHPVFLVLSLLMAWVGGVQATCTDKDLNVWYESDGTTLKPGVAIWAGADGIPLYDQAGGQPTGETLRLNEKVMTIEQIVRQEGKAWLRIRRANARVWVEAAQPGVICRSTPLRDEQGQLLQKVVVRVENKQGRRASVRLYRQPDAQEHPQDQDIRVFDFFFVYARHDDWRLLARGERLDSFKGGDFLGWVQDKDLIRWDTREVAATREGSPFLSDPGSGKLLARTTGAWGPEVRRPPILDKSKGPDNRTYLKVALPVELETNRQHSKNLERLVQAEEAWMRPLVVFLVDGTESTLPYLKEIHATLGKILRELDIMGEQRNVRFRYALYSYTDRAYGERWHTRRYQGVTTSDFSIRRAFETLREDTAAIEDRRTGGDDYPEDLYAGLRQVLDQELGPKVRESSLPILVVIGEHGSRPEDTHLRSGERRALDKLIPVFIRIGYPPNQTPDRTGSVLQQSAYAYKRFREDAQAILGERFDRDRFIHGETPKDTAQAVRKVLEDVFERQQGTSRAANVLALGGTWRQAVKAAGWPLAYEQAFRNLLLDKGYDPEVLDKGAFLAVIEAWVAEEDVTTEAFITKQELEEWKGLFKRIANRENWEAKRVEEIFAGSIGVYAREELWSRPLPKVLKARMGIPVQNSRLLGLSAGDLEGLERADFEYYARLFETFREALEILGRGELPRFEDIEDEYGIGHRRSIRIKETRPADFWFPYTAGQEAAYIPLENLP